MEKKKVLGAENARRQKSAKGNKVKKVPKRLNLQGKSSCVAENPITPGRTRSEVL